MKPATKSAKTNTDSGYHGLSEDEMEVDGPLETIRSPEKPSEALVDQATIPDRSQSQERSNNDKSFHSAKEDVSKSESKRDTPPQDLQVQASPKAAPPTPEKQDENTRGEHTTTTSAPQEVTSMDAVGNELDEELVVDESRSPSQNSSPARPLVRKSSLTFAALPAREPLTTKKSIGTRVSRTSHLDQHKPHLGRSSFLDRFTGGKSLGASRQAEISTEEDDDTKMESEVERPELAREESDGDSKMTKLHNKSSTQRLHDRINMLGKTQAARPNNPVAATVTPAAPAYPVLPDPEIQSEHLQQIAGMASKAMAAQHDDEDDDWIQPPQNETGAPVRPKLPKSVTADVMEKIDGKETIGGNTFHEMQSHEQTKRSSATWQITEGEAHADPADSSRDVAYPRFDSNSHKIGETGAILPVSKTPTGSPASKHKVDGHLSASKSKLQSIMKTARGLFSSSAGVSAQAKIETMSPSTRTCAAKQHQEVFDGSEEPVSNIVQSQAMQSPVINPVGRKTRSSTEKEEKRKKSQAEERAKASAEGVEAMKQINGPNGMGQQRPSKGPIPEAIQQSSKPTRQSPRRMQNHEAPKAQNDSSAQPMGPPPHGLQLPQSNVQKLKDGKRPIRPAKEPAPKPKPQPVAIRVMSQGLRMNNSALASGLQDSLPTTQSKQHTITKKPSNASIHSTVSNHSLKNTAQSAPSKPKALIAAERKKEQVCYWSMFLLSLSTDY